jgi:hypothetical protein
MSRITQWRPNEGLSRPPLALRPTGRAPCARTTPATWLLLRPWNRPQGHLTPPTPMPSLRFRRLGLETETRGCFMRVRRADRNGQANLIVVLGHHPDDADRLWWLLVMGAVQPAGISALRVISPIEEIATAADYVARALHGHVDDQRYAAGEGDAVPVPLPPAVGFSTLDRVPGGSWRSRH